MDDESDRSVIEGTLWEKGRARIGSWFDRKKHPVRWRILRILRLPFLFYVVVAPAVWLVNVVVHLDARYGAVFTVPALAAAVIVMLISDRYSWSDVVQLRAWRAAGVMLIIVFWLLFALRSPLVVDSDYWPLLNT